MIISASHMIAVSLLIIVINFEVSYSRIRSSYFHRYPYNPWPSSHLISQTNIWSPQEVSRLERPTQSILYNDEHSKLARGHFSLPASMNIVDVDKYYNDWHRSLSGYTTHRCQPIPDNMTLCQNLGYHKMLLPNYLHHEEVREVVEQSQIWLSLVHLECHLDLRKFLCSLYAPICVEEHQEDPIDPCRELCEDVKQKCLPKMMQFGFDWPDVIRCTRFTTSDSKMCVTKSETVRHRCSGCVSKPTFESVISGFCTADLVLRTRILYAFKHNHTTSSMYTLKLDRRPKALKLIPRARSLAHLQLKVDCECSALDRVLAKNPRQLGRWIIMGKLSEDSRFLQVEHLSQITRNNVGMKRAIRVIRHSKPKLCQLPVMTNNLGQSVKNSLGSDKSDDSLQFLGHKEVATNYRTGNNTRYQIPGILQIQGRQSNAPIFSLPRNSLPTSMTTMPTNRRSLVRRSQYHRQESSRFTTPAPLNPHWRQLQRVNMVDKNQLYKNNVRKFSNSRLTQYNNALDKSHLIQNSRIMFDSEKDLFSPQNLSPWLT